MRGQVGILVIATSIVQLANGFFGTFISLRIAIEDFDIAGLVLSAYFAGFTLRAFRCGKIVERIGHIFDSPCGYRDGVTLQSDRGTVRCGTGHGDGSPGRATPRQRRGRDAMWGAGTSGAYFRDRVCAERLRQRRVLRACPSVDAGSGYRTIENCAVHACGSAGWLCFPNTGGPAFSGQRSRLGTRPTDRRWDDATPETPGAAV
jgi:hypothetical protein